MFENSSLISLETLSLPYPQQQAQCLHMKGAQSAFVEQTISLLPRCILYSSDATLFMVPPHTMLSSLTAGSVPPFCSQLTPI